jgi:hypothetical protein
MVRFDAYTATARGLDPSTAVAWLFQPGDTMRQGRGFHTFAERLAVTDDTGSEVGSVSWGGRQGDRVMVEVKGERSPAVVEALRGAAEHRCTRVDSCADFDAPGAFAALLGPVEAVTRAHRLYAERRGDWELHPELGRTYMVGAQSSPIRARLYEKGKQPEYRSCGRPEWVRLELQVRPQKDAKDEYSSLSALDVWGASKWTRQLAADVLKEHLDPHPPGTIRRQTQRDVAIGFMVKQYGANLVSLAADLGGWDVLGLTLQEVWKAQQAGRGH